MLYECGPIYNRQQAFVVSFMSISQIIYIVTEILVIYTELSCVSAHVLSLYISFYDKYSDRSPSASVHILTRFITEYTALLGADGVFAHLIISQILPSTSCLGRATGYGPDDRGVGVRVPVGSRIFSSSPCPDRLWGPPNLLSNGYRGLFSRG
jgi:hypothetical protein